MGVYLAIYVLLFISIMFNILFLLRIKYLREEIREIKGGMQLSKDELDRIKSRLLNIRDRS
ncbi:hypothetical protein [Candidatus Pyrohabitans sp.]